MRGLWLAVSIGLCGGACSIITSGCTVYHAARADLPPEGHDRVTLRLRDAAEAARQALSEVQSAADDLSAKPRRLSPEEAGGVIESFGWELGRRVESIRDASTKTGVATPELTLAVDRLTRAEQRMYAAATALTKDLPEGVGSLADCREALDAGIAAAEQAIKSLRVTAK